MFNNIGSKIKKLATIMSVLGIVSSITAAIVIWTSIYGGTGALIGIAVAVFGSLLSWVSGFFIYGFGQLIENTDIIAQNSEKKPAEKKEKKQKADNDIVIAPVNPPKKVEVTEIEADTGDYRDLSVLSAGKPFPLRKRSSRTA